MPTFPHPVARLTRRVRATALTCALLGLAAAAIPAITTGCSGITRTPRDNAYLMDLRTKTDAQDAAAVRSAFAAFLKRPIAEQTDFAAGKRASPSIVDVLVISGGGDWGAFGAGVLKGWGTVPSTDPLARPEFDIVTGVSTGALIAPFAFAGDDESYEQIVHLYRNPQRDWVKERGALFFLPNNISFAEVPGLERDLRENINDRLIRKVAEGGREGRLLAVNTTNLDDGGPRVFMVSTEAQRAIDTGNADRVHTILLASSGIPAAFPYREIDGEMYVDGGVTGNIIYGGRLAEGDTLPGIWQREHPDLPLPTFRYWVLFNNQVRGSPAVVRGRWPDIVARSIQLSIRASTLTAVRHLFTIAELERLRYKANVEVRFLAIPDSWTPKNPNVFDKDTMNDLADLGERLGADPKNWSTSAPQ